MLQAESNIDQLTSWHPAAEARAGQGVYVPVSRLRKEVKVVDRQTSIAPVLMPYQRGCYQVSSGMLITSKGQRGATGLLDACVEYKQLCWLTLPSEGLYRNIKETLKQIPLKSLGIWKLLRSL